MSNEIKRIVKEVWDSFSFIERDWVREDIRFRGDIIKGALALAVRLGMDSHKETTK